MARAATDVADYDAMGDEEGISTYTIRSILSRDYVVGFFAFLGFLAAFHALIPTLPLYLATLGASKREIGMLVGTVGVSSLVSRLLVGRFLLRYSERPIMVGGAALFAISFLSLILFRPFWPFFVVRLLQGIAFASLDTAAIAYVVRTTPPTYRAQALLYFLLAPSFAAAFSATSGVFVVNRYGFAALLLACTGLSLCAALLSWRLKGGERTRPVTTRGPRNARFLETRILAPAAANFLIFFSWAGVAAFFPLYSVACGVANPGIFFSASAVMLIAARILGGKVFETYSKDKIISTFIAVSFVAMVTLSFSRTLPMFILVGLLWGMAAAFLFPVAMAYALEFAGSSDGAAVGTYQASMDLGLALGPVAMGVILPWTGYRVMFLSLALTCLINLGYFELYLRRRGNAGRTRHMAS